jgi:thiol-disulfide isomerase/thioredoxin
MMPMYPYRFSLLVIPLLCLFGLSQAKAQEFSVYDSLPQLTTRIAQAGEATLVVNFWATWCKPCVEELPCFEQLREQYTGKNVQVLLVSLDFKSQLEKKFIPFLKAQQLKSEVVLFADTDANTWIPYIYEEWDGAIPVTLVVKGHQKAFNLGKFDNYSDLEAFVLPFVGDTKAVSLKSLINCSSGK